MRKSIILIAVWMLMGFFTVVDESYAQRRMVWHGPGGWEHGSKYGRLFDPATVETINGEIVGIGTVAPIRGMHLGAEISVKTEKETVTVHLGPTWFIENQDVKLKLTEKVEVTGARIYLRGKPVIIASELSKGDRVLRLRDEDGYPVWSGWRRR